MPAKDQPEGTDVLFDELRSHLDEVWAREQRRVRRLPAQNRMLAAAAVAAFAAIVPALGTSVWLAFGAFVLCLAATFVIVERTAPAALLRARATLNGYRTSPLFSTEPTKR